MSATQGALGLGIRMGHLRATGVTIGDFSEANARRYLRESFKKLTDVKGIPFEEHAISNLVETTLKSTFARNSNLAEVSAVSQAVLQCSVNPVPP